MIGITIVTTCFAALSPTRTSTISSVPAPHAVALWLNRCIAFTSTMGISEPLYCCSWLAGPMNDGADVSFVEDRMN